ncbi:MAG: YdcF family protein, partial [Anaerotignaceae bacterium]
KEGIAKHVHTLFKACLLLFVLSFTICTAVVYQNGNRIPPKNADAIIVLGAGLRGEKVSLSLAYRLDAAIDYYNQNQNSVIIVSGGQGKNELVSEAFAMKTYLLEKGIPEAKIITEDKSSRTVENFSFSKEILDKYFNGTAYETVYVTNSFHIFRAGLIAKQANLVSHGLSAKNVDFLQPTYYIREYFSIIKYFAIDYI